MFNLEKREEKRQAACDKLFKEIIADPKYIVRVEPRYWKFPED
jgi:hypothetical protein